MEEGAGKQKHQDECSLHRNRIENSTKDSSARRHSNNSLPPLFLYIEAGNFQRAAERAKKYPREVRTWASIKIKSSVGNQQRLTTTKRLALHHACFKVCTYDDTCCNEVFFLIEMIISYLYSIRFSRLNILYILCYM
jgi:hypothetical protein